MYKKLLILNTFLISASGFSQKILDTYEAPRVVAHPDGVRMLPGFHANANDANYGTNSFRAIQADESNTTQAPIVYTPSSGENYVYSRTYLYPTTQSNVYVPQSQSITYFDGLGRPKQSIAIKASPSGEDLVTHIPYDGFGRQVDSWLPGPMATQNGGIQSTPESAASSFYGSYAFSHKTLESSPLDRVMSLTQPGSDWQAHPVTYDYQLNTSGEVIKFVTRTSWSEGITNSTIILADIGDVGSNDSGYYKASLLYKNKVADEDGNISYEYKNGQGQTLLVKKMNGSEALDTYYVYNEYNQLAFVLSPLAVKAINDEGLGAGDQVSVTNILNHLAYQYKYDVRNRLAEKKLPGKGWEYMVYDKQDRLVSTQDANLRLNNQWLYTKYDKFSRTIMTGISNGSGSSRSAEQSHAESFGANNEIRGSQIYAGYNGLDLYYTVHSGYPTHTAVVKLLSVNYYDSYPTGSAPAPSSAEVFNQKLLTGSYTASEENPNALLSTQGLPTASYIKNIDDNQWTKAYTFYDQKGRSVYTHSINHLGGFTKTSNLLDFTGAVLKTKTQHKRAGAFNDYVVNINERFVYDNQNRLKQHYHQVDGGTEELLTSNTYNSIGQLVGKTVGNGLESTNYSYNIRGWMTGINDIQNLGSNLFAYKIRYNDEIQGLITPNVDYPNHKVKSKFNGNIAEIEWKTLYSIGSDPGFTPERQGFVYDGANRLSAGFYQDPQNPSSKSNSEIIDYDLNGNILHLKRTGARIKGQVKLIDNLSYTYTGNQVTNINDVMDNPMGYEGGNGLIKYDANGNMTVMPDKKITNISYNFLNLPTLIEQPNKTAYLYRADGVKLRKKFTASNTSGMASITTDYLDGFHYTSAISTAGRQVLELDDSETIRSTKAGQVETFQNPEIVEQALPDNPGDQFTIMNLKFFPTSEGYYDYEKKQYIYQYKDHLGNSRLNFARSSAGVREILDYNNYYPFGLNFSEGNAIFDVQGSPYNYKYNGKELQETGMYDYGARFYMPDIGRWGVIDPLAELQFKYSPYSYVYNNPIMFNDPTGMIGEDPKKSDPNKVYYGGEIEEVVIQPIKPINTSLAFVGINNLYAYHASQDRYAAAIRGSKAALATEKFEKNLAFTMGTFMMGGSNLLASAGWSGFDWWADYQDPEDQEAIQIVQLAAIAVQIKHGNVSGVPKLTKSVNLPSWKKIIIDMEHVASGHMKDGSRVSSLKTLFPENLSKSEVKKLILDAYKNSKRIKVQEDRILLQGNNIEMWLNSKTKIIETAYPIR